MNVTPSLLDDIKTKQLLGMDMFKEWKRGVCQKKLQNGVRIPKLTGHKGLED
jgi:hypothetical protein